VIPSPPGFVWGLIPSTKVEFKVALTRPLPAHSLNCFLYKACTSGKNGDRISFNIRSSLDGIKNYSWIVADEISLTVFMECWISKTVASYFNNAQLKRATSSKNLITWERFTMEHNAMVLIGCSIAKSAKMGMRRTFKLHARKFQTSTIFPNHRICINETQVSLHVKGRKSTLTTFSWQDQQGNCIDIDFLI